MLLIAGFRVRSEQGGGTDRPSRVVGAGFKTRPVSIPPSNGIMFHLEGESATCSVARAAPQEHGLGEVVTHELDADGGALPRGLPGRL